jgi:Mor family transcriptional regulator
MFDNTADMMAKGRKNCARGESAGSNKLTEAQVTEIRRLYAAGGHSYPSLGRRYGVAQSSIYGIINRRTWAHVA